MLEMHSNFTTIDLSQRSIVQKSLISGENSRTTSSLPCEFSVSRGGINVQRFYILAIPDYKMQINKSILAHRLHLISRYIIDSESRQC